MVSLKRQQVNEKSLQSCHPMCDSSSPRNLWQNVLALSEALVLTGVTQIHTKIQLSVCVSVFVLGVSFKKIYGLYGLKRHTVENIGCHACAQTDRQTEVRMNSRQLCNILKTYCGADELLWQCHCSKGIPCLLHGSR